MNARLFLAINGLAHRNPVLDGVMIAAAVYGPLLLAALLLWRWFAGDRKRTRAAFRAALCGLLALGVAPLVGLLHRQPIPPAAGLGRPLIPHELDNSFPSDHASLSFAVAVSLILSGDGLWPWALALAVLISFARVFVGVHFPGDILAGAGVGTAVALAAHVARGHLDRLADGLKGFQDRMLRRIGRGGGG